MTRNDALRKLYGSPGHRLLYKGSHFGNELLASLSRAGIIEIEYKGDCPYTMILTEWGRVLAEELAQR